MLMLAVLLLPTLSVAQPTTVHARIDASSTGAPTPRTVDATITVGQKPGVEVQEEALASLPEAVVAPPFSVSIYSFAVGS
jgi:hypothetical protein